mmetsp:Transcript_41404/g.99738  ORF Transcript_41404/g.99738 Transcript_41404/m.99738 type:complete len:273 (-) Transcript_41404:2746-3564(-)
MNPATFDCHCSRGSGMACIVSTFRSQLPPFLDLFGSLLAGITSTKMYTGCCDSRCFTVLLLLTSPANGFGGHCSLQILIDSHSITPSASIHRSNQSVQSAALGTSKDAHDGFFSPHWNVLELYRINSLGNSFTNHLAQILVFDMTSSSHWVEDTRLIRVRCQRSIRCDCGPTNGKSTVVGCFVFLGSHKVRFQLLTQPISFLQHFYRIGPFLSKVFKYIFDIKVSFVNANLDFGTISPSIGVAIFHGTDPFACPLLHFSQDVLQLFGCLPID